jgi:ubiquitin carboxyl-terminal hydrolase 5/13
MAHYEASGHAVSVKLGTITPEGDAGKELPLLFVFFPITSTDIYCYACNDAKEDPDLARHLASFGINVQTLTKTEMNMTELVCPSFLPDVPDLILQQQIEQNLKYDFSLTGDDGKALEPVFGPGLTGLANLGNRQAFPNKMVVLPNNAL